MTCICKSHAGMAVANISYAAAAGSKSGPRLLTYSSSLLYCANCDKIVFSEYMLSDA